MARNSPERNAGSEARKHSRFANEGEVIPADEPALDGPTGRQGGAEDVTEEGPDEELSVDVGAQPMSEITARREETEDGLDDTEEAVRREAEDRPLGRPSPDSSLEQ